jgi:hypothetical protein
VNCLTDLPVRLKQTGDCYVPFFKGCHLLQLDELQVELHAWIDWAFSGHRGISHSDYMRKREMLDHYNFHKTGLPPVVVDDLYNAIIYFPEYVEMEVVVDRSLHYPQQIYYWGFCPPSDKFVNAFTVKHYVNHFDDKTGELNYLTTEQFKGLNYENQQTKM